MSYVPSHVASHAPSHVPSRVPSRAVSRTQNRAPSRAGGSTHGPLFVDLPPLSPRPPIYVDLPAERPRARSQSRTRSRSRARSQSRPRARSQSRPRALVEAPGLSRGRGMFKRLIVACDGTWLNADNGLVNGKIEVPSNVTRISRAIKPVSQDGIPQIVYYHFGVGTQGGVVDRILSGTTGEGLSDAVREGYSFLANNYHPGDEIFLLGFSRGAFTARSIAGLVGQIGLLTKKGLHTLPEVFKDVQHRRDERYVPKSPDVPFSNKPSADSPRYADELERRGMTRLDIPIKAIGVWDTVGSLGTPRVGWLTKVGLQSAESKEMSFYDTKLSSNIENAFQALALDEKRGAFSPAVWEKPEGNRTTLRQVWFPGAHSNVGGGYDDQQLANITLAWMMSQLQALLDLREEYMFEQDAENAKYYKKERLPPRPWSFGEVYNSMKGLYALGGGSQRTPGLYHACSPDTGRPTPRPLRQTNEYIHPSVRTRLRLVGPGVADKHTYECRALTDNYRLVVDYSTTHSSSPTTTKPEPDIYWKAKFAKDEEGVRVIPEAPLWGVEKELCRRDREMWEAVRKPPPTGSPGAKPKRQKARMRPVSVDLGNGHNGRASKRNSLIDDGGGGGGGGGGHGRRSTIEKGDMRHGARSKSRARSAEYERESVVRGEMPHRREKDKAWWEGVAEGMGMRSSEADRREKANGERVLEKNGDAYNGYMKEKDLGYKEKDSGRSPRFKDERRASRVDYGNGAVARSPRRSSMRV